MKDDNHNEIIHGLNDLKEMGNNIVKRLDTLNGSVAKHEARFGTQDVMNAQTTLTQQQIMEDLKVLKAEARNSSDFRLEANTTINVFKWLVGLIGIGTLITLFKSFFS